MQGLAFLATLALTIPAHAQPWNPVPTLTNIVATAGAPGSAGFTITVNGVGFVPGAEIYWNGMSPRLYWNSPTTCIPAFKNLVEASCTVYVPAQYAPIGTANVSVSNPQPGGGISNTLYFQVSNSNPSVAISVSTKNLSSGPTDMTVGVFSHAFDSRGRPSLTTALLFPDHVEVTLGTSGATFTKSVNLAQAVNSASRIVAADLNNDGNADLIVSAGGFVPAGGVNCPPYCPASAVYILMNDGSGNFSPRTIAIPYSGSNSFSSRPDALAVGDFNNDGKLDIAVALDGSTGSFDLLLGNGDGTFGAPQGFGSASFSVRSGLAVGDFNGDGNLDLAEGDENGLTVWAGDGGGHFSKLFNATNGNGILSLVSADFNGDGKLDLATIPLGEASVLVFMGDGKGGFAQSRTQVDFSPYLLAGYGGGYTNRILKLSIPGLGLAAGDINADGKIDLVVTSGFTYPGQELVFLLGNGDGTFQTANVPTPSGNPVVVSLADMNQDGLLDVVLMGDASLSVMEQIYPNTTLAPGQVTFPIENLGIISSKTFTYISSGGLPVTLSGIRISGPNQGDFSISKGCGGMAFPVTLAPNQSCNVTVTFTRTQAGTRSATLTFVDSSLNGPKTMSLSGGATANPVPFITGLSPDTVTAGSTAPEILTVNGGGFGSKSVVQLNGKSLVTHGFSGSSVSAIVPPAAMATASTATLTVVNPSPGGVSNALPLTIGTATRDVSLTRTDLPVGGNPNSIANGDFNGDGIQDFAVTSQADNAVNILLGDGKGGFTAAKSLALTGNGPSAIAAGDFNGDGFLDLAVANTSSSNVTILLGDGKGGFTAATLSPGTGQSPVAIALGDFNRDSNLDLALVTVAHGTANGLTILLGDGKGGFTNFGSPAAPGNFPASVVTADFNRDGNLDLAVANSLDNTLTIYLGDGAGNFAISGAPVLTGDYPRTIAVADLNGDGIPDLAVANGGIINRDATRTVSILLGDGKGGFSAATPATTGTNPFWVVAADFNRDGKMDLATADYADGTATVLLGDGKGGFTAQAPQSTGANPIALAVADFNNDGRIDLAVVDFGANSVSVLLQQPGTASGGISPDSIWSGGPGLSAGQQITSHNGGFRAVMQTDGNFVIYDATNKPLWATGTNGQGFPPYRLAMQSDGNLVVYAYLNACAPKVPCSPTWASGTNGKGIAPYILVMQNDGNLVIYDSTLTATWASGTSR